MANAWTWRRWDRIVADAPWNIAFEMLRGAEDPLILEACNSARQEAWNLELGPANRDEVRAGIAKRLRAQRAGTRLPQNAVLIGGPPCQAYSIVGRSRNRGKLGYRPEADHRHFLYKEYLQVISDFRPAVFVMENVKGVLTSKVADLRIFHAITDDIKRPDLACGIDVGLEYVLFAFGGTSSSLFDPEPEDFIVEAETFGVPQARHRVIIGGIRRDVFEKSGETFSLRRSPAPTVGGVISDLPRLRAALSFRGNGQDWTEPFASAQMKTALNALERSGNDERVRVASRMKVAASAMTQDPGTGSDRVLLERRNFPSPEVMAGWYMDRPLTLLANHEARSHMPTDLVRYLFVSAFGKETGRSPRLEDFPPCLLPEHRNVDPEAIDSAIFKDRFRVQLENSPSKTVTSHIAKDGHAFIHHDETQCRSLTVREAARLQTFPDSYVFLGNRTSQYTQVGNAVPPYLAFQIAEVVGGVLARAGLG
jgi:DNA (cytosine-5)-methyltransferase 1